MKIYDHHALNLLISSKNSVKIAKNFCIVPALSILTKSYVTYGKKSEYFFVKDNSYKINQVPFSKSDFPEFVENASDYDLFTSWMLIYARKKEFKIITADADLLEYYRSFDIEAEML